MTRNSAVAAPAILVSGLLVAASSMIYELAIAQTIATLYGATVLRYSLTIGLFVASLGAGAMFWASRPRTDPAGDLFKLELSLVVLGAFSPLNIFAVEYVQQLTGINAAWPGLISSHIVVIAIGTMSGMEIPAFIDTAKSYGYSNWIGQIVGIDFLGSCIGALVFPLIIFPNLGLIASTMYSGMANVLAALLALSLARQPVGLVWKTGMVSVALLLIITTYFESWLRSTVVQLLF